VNRDSLSQLALQGLRKPREHLDDTVVSGAQLLIDFVRDIVQVFREQELIANLAGGSVGGTNRFISRSLEFRNVEMSILRRRKRRDRARVPCS
jgi:hypothetical protein